MFHDVNDLITYIQNQKRPERKESLDYMFSLCEFFGNPQQNINFIHIGGTNGKGSTVSFIKNMLMQKYNVGSFISPFIVCFNERITYNNEYISDDDILRLGNYIISKFEELELRIPSFFEFITLLAFLYFKEKKLDYVVIEVGIGGTLDCTNVIKPLVSSVTNVSYDHMNILGNTLTEIWDNKLGIVKRGVPFVTHYNQEFLDKINSVCQQNKAPLTLITKSDIAEVEVNLTHTKFDFQKYKDIELQMLGYHQIENAVLAIKVVECVADLTKENIYQGLYQSTWPGRLEIISKEPLIILDGAHNIGGIKRLKEFLQLTKQYIRIIFAVSANKEKQDMISEIETIADEIIFTQFNYKRSDESGVLNQLSQHPNKKMIDDIDALLKICYQDNVVNVFCGSLYLISEIRSKVINGR